MEARTTRRAGQKGTKRLLERIGERLLFVRYRCDRIGRRRVTTAELMINERPWTPPAEAPAPPSPTVLPHAHSVADLVAVRIEAHEPQARTRLKEASGKWDARRRVWLLPLRRARVLGLDHSIVS